MKLIVISNRLPITLKEEQGEYQLQASSGGLVTGIDAYLQKAREKGELNEFAWIGWPGANPKTKQKKQQLEQTLIDRYNYYPVFYTDKAKEKFYNGFSNKTIWPLFHYFVTYTVYDDSFWENYQAVNRMFCETLQEVYVPGDVIWIHDYHLMLLPGMVREILPKAQIGFFLHIPFPSYEMFRLLPVRWSKPILENLLGADLIGFHTQDYTKYFQTSVVRILGHDRNIDHIYLDDRIIKTSTFPMGIDYTKYSNIKGNEQVMQETEQYREMLGGKKAIISIDRLDYTKGVLNRLKGYAQFLNDNPQWHEKVVLVMLVVPSREGVESYQAMKKQIDEYIGKINGNYSSIGWTPVIYLYKSLDLNSLLGLYAASDAILVTPLRDGMNLVAKEYIASRYNQEGVLILSEMAGAASELGEAIQINPNDFQAISDAILEALEMPVEQQIHKNQIMQTRLRRYTVVKWASDFLDSLKEIKKEQDRLEVKQLNPLECDKLIEDYRNHIRRALFIDYDGTLVPLVKSPELAIPGTELTNILAKISQKPGTDVFIISGRDKNFLQKWLGHLNIQFIAEHGVWKREEGLDWQLMNHLSNEWMPSILSLLEDYSDKLPGSFVEEKDHSLAWHYRKSDEDLAPIYAESLVENLKSLVKNQSLQVLQGSKVIEIKNSSLNKGTAVHHFHEKKEYSFFLAIGDDTTDEDMFKALASYPESVFYTLRVGLKPTRAKYSVHNYREVVALLKKISEMD